MMRHIIPTLVFLAATSTLPAQATPLKVKEEKAGQLKQAKVSPDAALATAAAKVPGATLTSAEIEREDGKLLYVFSFAKVGVKGEEEVSVDALTGVLHRVEHETPADEAREAREDAAKKKGKSAAGAAATPSAPAKRVKPPVG